MRIALLAFLASRALLVAALVLFSPLEEHWWPADAEKPWSGTEEHGRVGWKSGGDNGRYLFHPSALVDGWFRHDSGFYLQIAMFGYGRASEGKKSKEGFLPGFPVLMRALRPAAQPLAKPLAGPETQGLVPWPLVSALLVNTLSSLVALVLMVRLARRFLDGRTAARAGVILAVSPLGFLFGTGLTEAVFMMFLAGALLAAERGNVLLASVLGACACLTRITGLALLVPLAAAAWERRDKLAAVEFVGLLLVPAGLLVALLVVGSGSGDPWTYFKVQAQFGHEGFPTLAGLTDLFTLKSFDPFEVHRNCVQVAVLGVALALVVLHVRWSARGTLPWSWLVFSLSMVAFPVLAGNVISLPRYAVVILPLYVVAARSIPGGLVGWLLAALSLIVQVVLFLGFEAHLPVII